MNEPARNVAVIIAAYKAPGTIARAIRSALAEANVSEVIVVDDCSGDNTTDKARACDDGSGRLKIIGQSQNSGPSAARNAALKIASAEWIGILDSDDFFLPGRFARLLEHAENADFLADDMWQVDEDAVDGPRRALIGDALQNPRSVSLHDFVMSNVSERGRQRGELGFLKPIIRKAFLDDHNIRYQEQMRLGEDYELYARCLAEGARFKLIPARGYVSVVRANSLSGQHTEEDLQNLRDCNLALERLPKISSEDRQALRKHYLSIDCRLQWRRLISAVKARNISDAISTFTRPYPVPFYVLGQLAEQAYLRSFGRFRKAA